jgi:hypothetical protein
MGSPPYWFPAKRYGWGWGLPTVWQGRLVFIAFFVLVALAVYVFPPARNLAAFLASTVVLVIVLLAVCYAKGEPPSWRWGK